MSHSILVRGARLLAAALLTLVIVLLLTLETIAGLVRRPAARRRPLPSFA